MGSRLSTPRLMLTMPRKPRNALRPRLADWPANCAMLIGPLRFSTEASPTSIFHRVRRVSRLMSRVLAMASPSACTGP